MSRAPQVFELDAADDKPAVTPETAPPPPETPEPLDGDATQLAVLDALGPSRSPLARIFWAALMLFVGFMLSMAAYDFIAGMLARNLWLGRAALALAGIAVLSLILMTAREIAAVGRLKKIESLQTRITAAWDSGSRKEAEAALSALSALYENRKEMDWAHKRIDEGKADQYDADGILTLAERELLGPLDGAAEIEIRRAARSVATVTAIVPVGLLDAAAVLYLNTRMIRRIARVYGGRAGWFGSIRLLRAVMGHLLATGLISLGDDLLGPLLGGGMLSKVSRRFGEGLVNGALTARIGLAAMDVCRPAPWRARERPALRAVVAGALKGLVSRDSR